MAITTHKSEAQMVRDYSMRSGTADSKAATLRLLSNYTSGNMKRLPPTAVEKSETFTIILNYFLIQFAYHWTE